MAKAEKIGEFKKDASGLFHYKKVSLMGTVFEAVENALAIRPKTKACWFWFNDTPAPIYRNDTKETLLARWHEWRSAYQSDGEKFLNLMKDLTPA